MQKKEDFLNEESLLDKYSVLASVTDALVYDYDVRAGTLSWKGNVFGITGYSEKDFCRTIKNWEEMVHPDDKKRVVKELDLCMGRKKRYSVEYRIKTKSKGYILVEDDGKFIYDSSGKAYKMIGLMKDITDKKLKEGALISSQKIISGISNNLSSAMIYQAIVFPDGGKKFTYFSDSIKKFYGVSAEAAIKNPDLIYRRFHSEDKPNLLAAESKAIKNLTPFKFETRVNDPSGKIRWSYFVSTPRKLEDGSYCFDGIEFDITEQKMAAEKIKSGEEKFSKAFYASPNLMAITTLRDGLIKDVNEAYCTFLGYKRERLVGHTTLELNIWADPNQRADIVARIKKDGFVKNAECYLRRSSGEIIVVILSMVSITLNNESCLLSVAVDITEKKKIEEALRNSEARFRGYFNMPLHGIAITSPEKGWLEVNSKVCSILGYTREELLRKSWVEMTYPADLAADEKQFDKLLAGKIDTYSMNKRFVRKDKKVIWTSLSVGCVRKSDGKVDYVVALLEDITERKKAEEELKKSEEKFKAMFDSSPIGMYLYKKNDNGDLIFREANSSADKIIGVNHNSFVGKKIGDAFPGLLKTNIPSEYKKVVDTGHSWHGSQVEYHRGKISGVYDVFAFRTSSDTLVVTFTDITNEKQIQEELKKAKEHVELQVAERTRELNKQKVFFSSILENVPDMIFVKDAKNLKFELFNRAGEELLGYDRKDLLGKSDYDFFPKEQAEFFIQKDRAVLKNEKLLDIPEEPINTKSGKKFLHTKKIPLVTSDGDKYLLGISEDITETKRKETEYSTVVNSMHDGFYVVDDTGKFLTVNESYCKMSGYTRDELLKMKISSIEALQSAKEIGERIKEIKIVGSGRFETQHKHKGGGLIDVEISVTYLESGNKFFSFVHDITQRKKSEREILARARELEKFNKIAIGRELKMVELKKKIKKLEEGRD